MTVTAPTDRAERRDAGRADPEAAVIRQEANRGGGGGGGGGGEACARPAQTSDLIVPARHARSSRASRA
jgi:hypothetical protein